MSDKTYPYKGWILQPSFKPVEVEIARLDDGYADYEVSASGKYFRLGEVQDTKINAIKLGRTRLQKQQDDLDKKQANLNKRMAALDKAESKS